MTLKEARTRVERLLNSFKKEFPSIPTETTFLGKEFTLLVHSVYHEGRRDLDSQLLQEEREAFKRGE